MTWQILRREFINESDVIAVTGRPTGGLLGLRRAAPNAKQLGLGDELLIELSPDEPGYVTLLVTIEPLERTVCLVPGFPDDARGIDPRDGGFGYPEEGDPHIVLEEPLGLHTVYATVTGEPLPEPLRRSIAERQGDCDPDLLDEIAVALAAIPNRELHQRRFTVGEE